MKISKLPWIAIDNEIINSDGRGVAECSSNERASQIVTVVNTRDELIKDSKVMLDALRCYKKGIIPIKDFDFFAAKLRKSIKKAEKLCGENQDSTTKPLED